MNRQFEAVGQAAGAIVPQNPKKKKCPRPDECRLRIGEERPFLLQVI